MTVHINTVGPPIRANSMEPEVLRQILDALTYGTSGGVVGATDLAVTQNGTPNMSVNVAAGFVIVPGTISPPAQGQYIVYNDGTVNLSIAASSANPRVDLVEMQVRDAYYSGASNDARLNVVTGVAATSPTVPAADANSVVLAHIYVPASASSIVTANINGTTGTNNPDAAAAYVAPYVVTLSRDIAWYHGSGAGSAGFTGERVAATVVLPNTGSAYRVKLACNELADGTVGTDQYQVQIRHTNISGSILKSARGAVGSQLVIPTFNYDVSTPAANTFVMTTQRHLGSGTLTTYTNDTSSYLDAEVIPL